MIEPIDLCGEWAILREAAERLLADRERSDPAAVASRKLPAEAADSRKRCAQTLVAVLRAVDERDEIPVELPAGWAEVREDLARAEAAFEKPLADRPGDAALLRRARLVATLRYQFEPYREGARTPGIVFCHEFNQHARTLSAPKRAAA